MKVKMVNIGLFTMKKVKNFTEAMKIVSLISQHLQDFSAIQRFCIKNRRAFRAITCQPSRKFVESAKTL